jgi:hypothetical protein
MIMPPSIDHSLYEETQLAEDEIISRERARLAIVVLNTAKECERQRRMRAFRFQGGLL